MLVPDLWADSVRVCAWSFKKSVQQSMENKKPRLDVGADAAVVSASAVHPSTSSETSGANLPAAIGNDVLLETEESDDTVIMVDTSLKSAL